MKEQKQTAPLDDGPGLEAFLPDTSQGFVAQAGTALAEGAGPADAIIVEDALKPSRSGNSGQYIRSVTDL